MDYEAMMEFYEEQEHPKPQPPKEPERKPGGFPIVLNIPEDAKHPQMTSAIALHLSW